MKKLFALIIFFLTFNLFSQKEANFWYFGENAGLDFSTSPPTSINGQLSTDEGSAVISNKDGELLFYTNGTIVYNKKGLPMLNGGNLLGNSSSTQSAIIVPKPLDDTIYYIFTVGNQGENEGVRYSQIDTTLDNNLGGITARKNLPLNSSREGREKITAIASEICDTFWVITADYNNFYAYKVDVNGVNTNPIVSPHKKLFDIRGYLKLSPDGKFLVSANAFDDTFIYNFNNKTGIISNERMLSFSGYGYGVAFSRTSKKLYISTGINSQIIINTGNRTPPETAKIYQFDLTVDAINSSKAEIYSTTQGYRGALQLALDGKIYYARSRQNSLGVINSPDASGNNVNFIENAVSLGNNLCTEGLPPFIQSFFTPVNIVNSYDNSIQLNNYTQQLCIQDTLTIEPELKGDATSTYVWTKEGDTSILSNTRVFTIRNSNYGSGVYNLEMEITDNCGRLKKYNSSIEVIFNPPPTLKKVEKYVQCDFDNNTIDGSTFFNLASKEQELSGGADNVTVAFFEPEDTSYSKPIIDKASYKNPLSHPFKHTLLVKITNTRSGCFNTGTLDLEVSSTSLERYAPIYETEIDNHKDIINATNSEGSGEAFFNLNDKIAEIITTSNNTFNNTEYQFSFFKNKEDAEKERNAINIDKPLRFANDTKIYVRISKGNTCAGVGEFHLFVNQLPILNVSLDTVTLCINNPIDTPQLITTKLDANTGVAGDTYQWFFNNTIISNEKEAVLSANKEGTYRVEVTRFYANNTSLKDDSFTKGYHTFTVKESNIARIESVTFLDDQDNPEDNTIMVTVSGKGDYEFALNDNLPSSFIKGANNLSYTFKNVPPGLNKVYINDRNKCGLVNTKEVSFLVFQKHFTPNGDGFLDTWKILGAEKSFYKDINLQIFDRYGNVLKVLNINSTNGWNGIFNGKLLPANDYWYNAILIDINNNIRKKTGHFSLIRK